MDPGMAPPHNDRGSFDENFLHYVPEELILQPDNSFNRLCSFIAATKAGMPFSAVLPMGVSAIASSSKPVPCSDTNRNSNNMTTIPNITNNAGIENTKLGDGSTIEEGAMSVPE